MEKKLFYIAVFKQSKLFFKYVIFISINKHKIDSSCYVVSIQTLGSYVPGYVMRIQSLLCIWLRDVHTS